MPKKNKEKRTRLPENAVCDLCGCTREDTKIRKFNDYILCSKHYQQLVKYGKITDPTPVVHKYEVKKCCICGEKKHATFEGKDYCQKHFIQMTRHGKIDKTIYDKNEYVLHDDYTEIILCDKNGNEAYRTKIDLDKVEELSKYKIYAKGYKNKLYANLNFPGGKKIRLNRYLLGIIDTDEWDGKIVVDHINGDSLDNRLCNLRKCTFKENSINIRKNYSFVGIKRNTTDTKWVATLMKDYKSIWLGCYDNKYEAMLARIKGEKEHCGEFGCHKDLYYLIDHSSPIEELKKYSLKKCNRIGESAAIKLYNRDKADGYWVPEDTNLYASYIYKPNDSNVSVLDKFVMHGDKFIGEYCDGGQSAHVNLDSHLSILQYHKLLDYAGEVGCKYFTFNIPNCECEDCHYIAKQPFTECPKCGSKNVSLWDRIIG